MITNAMAILELRKQLFATNGYSAGEHNCIGGWICEARPHVEWPHLLSQVGLVSGNCAGPGMQCDYPNCQFWRYRRKP